MPRLFAAAPASTVRPVLSPNCSLITFNNCKLFSSTLPSQHPTPPGPGLSLVACGYTPVGESVQAVCGKAGAGVALEVSAPQQLLDQGMAFAPARVHAYADCRSTHGYEWGWLP